MGGRKAARIVARVNVVLGFGVLVAVTAVAIAAMLLVRSRAPEGGYFADG